MQRLSEASPNSCPKCGGEPVSRPAHPYPVALTAVFGLSFVVFLAIQGSAFVLSHRAVMYGWTAFQAALGVALIRARLRARKRVYRCIRCDAALP